MFLARQASTRAEAADPVAGVLQSRLSVLQVAAPASPHAPLAAAEEEDEEEDHDDDDAPESVGVPSSHTRSDSPEALVSAKGEEEEEDDDEALFREAEAELSAWTTRRLSENPLEGAETAVGADRDWEALERELLLEAAQSRSAPGPSSQPAAAPGGAIPLAPGELAEELAAARLARDEAVEELRELKRSSSALSDSAARRHRTVEQLRAAKELAENEAKEALEEAERLAAALQAERAAVAERDVTIGQLQATVGTG